MENKKKYGEDLPEVEIYNIGTNTKVKIHYNKGKTERDIFINKLRSLWEYSNSTAYYDIVRQKARAKMINRISDYLENSKKCIGLKEEDILLSFIRVMATLMVERTSKNKKAIKRHLETLEAYNNNKKGEK